ncbi:MAG: hypothetical protein ABJB11_00905 [Ferruginibacter sp.]
MKSFLLSIILLSVMCFFIFSIFENKISRFYSSFPVWVFIAIAIVFFAGFILSFYWGITGVFKEQRLFNIGGIGCSFLGLGICFFGFIMQAGKGKEMPGQFDHELSKIETAQQAALHDLLQQTNTKAADVQFIPYWEMNRNTAGFAICIQKGNVIALQIKKRALKDVSNISKLSHLNWLALESCGLKSIETLNLPELERLSVNHNHLTSLNGLQHSPKVGWLDFTGNPITDSSALQQLNNPNLIITTNQ